jgi:hypothetical protein
MFPAFIAVTLLATVANFYSAANEFWPPSWLIANMDRLRVPHSWLTPLGILKAAGAAGLLVGFAVPWIGVAAAAGLVLFFLGAIVFALRARWFAHIPFPASWMALAVAALVLRVLTAHLA